MCSQTTFSVLVPIHHGGPLLRRSLEALLRLEYPPEAFEVLLPGRGQDSFARAIVEQVAARAPFRLQYVPTDACTRAGALNAALATARGTYLAFADDDVQVPGDWLRRLEEAFAGRPEAGLVGGADEMTGDAGLLDLAFDAVLRSPIGGGRIRCGSPLGLGEYYPRLWNMAMPHAVALRAALDGGAGPPEVFKSSLPAHEDVELGRRVRRLGGTILFLPDLKVLHRRRTSFTALVRRDFLSAGVCRREGIHRAAHVALAGGLVGAAALAGAAAVWRPAALALAAAATAYGLALLALGVTAALRGRQAALLLAAPAVAVSLHLARAAGYLLGARRT